MSQAKRWCFTLNNYTAAEDAAVRSFLQLPIVLYGGVGLESGVNGTPHHQGWFYLRDPKRLRQIKAWVIDGTAPFARAHLEVMRGTVHASIAYCSKDGNYQQYGEQVPAAGQGRRTDLDEVLEWGSQFIEDNGRAPTKREIAVQCPKALLRYKNFYEMMQLRAPTPVLQQGEPRPWQRNLQEELDAACEDTRIIQFYVDTDGGKGKTWFQQWYFSLNPDRVQILGVGKKTDVAYVIDESKSIFFFNVARGGMEFFSYQLAESLKDRLVFSTKYESTMKVLHQLPHVVVFCNEEPDYEKLSADRYRVVFL